MIYVLLACLGMYLLWVVQRRKIGAVSGKSSHPKSALDYLHSAPQRLLVFSLIGANLSVTGGIIALTSASDKYGGWIIAAPFTTFLGFALFLWIFRPTEGTASRFALENLNRFFSGEEKRPSLFALYYGVSVIVIYAFFLGWEIYVGSQVLGELVFKQPDANDIFLIGIILTAVIAIYTFFGGFASVVETDLIQTGLCVLVLFVLIFANWGDLGTWRWSYLTPEKPLSDETLLALVGSLLFINGTHQLISPINWHIGETSGRKLGAIIAIASVVLCIFWGSILFVAFSYSGFPSYPGVLSVEAGWQKALLIIGITGFVMSSADSLTFGCANTAFTIYSIYSKNLTSFHGMEEKSEFEGIRIFVIVFLLAVLAATYGLMQTRPQIFLTLVAIGGCLSVYVPALITAGLRKATSSPQRLHDWSARLLLLGCFLSAGLQAVWLVILGQDDEASSLAVFATVLGTMLYGVLTLLGLRGKATR